MPHAAKARSKSIEGCGVQGHSPRRRGRRSAVGEHGGQILTRMARILIMSGESPQAIAREFAAICRRLNATPVQGSGAGRTMIDHAHVISSWHSRPEYLDKAGRPRGLHYAGAPPSLKGLISRVLPRAKPDEVLGTLRRLGAVREQDGIFRPAGRWVSFGQERADTLAWLLSVLGGVMQTIEHNAQCAPEDRLPDRTAMNPRFPIRALPVLHARVRRYAMQLLRDVDNDMQREEVVDASEPTTGVGVVVFAFEDPLVTGSPRMDGGPREAAPRARGRRKP